jgi:hypothetical protein
MSTIILLINDFCFNGLFLGGFIAGEVIALLFGFNEWIVAGLVITEYFTRLLGF